MSFHKRFSHPLRCLGAGGILFFASAVTLYCLLPDFGDALKRQRNRAALAVVDRNDRLLRIVPDERERFSFWCDIGRIPRSLKQAVIAAEDRRFYFHPGFDPISVLRAAFTNLHRRKIVSGASTITQQVVRLIRPRPRTYKAKLMELLESLKMECQLSKEEILELYFNLSPMGGNVRGVGLAARLYFGKDVERINTAEAAILAAIPRSPSRYDFRSAAGRQRLLSEKDLILRRMASLGWVSGESLTLMMGPNTNLQRRDIPLEAPHLVDFVLRQEPDQSNPVQTTLDLDIQHNLEHILRSHKNRLATMGIHQAGAMVVAARSCDVLGMVGSLSYSDRNQGYNNAVLASRSAGSALKPFLYALALEKGGSTFSEIADTFRSYPTPRGDYLPFNADRRWYGPVTMRLALGNSLNMPAVKTLRSVGINEFYALMEDLGIINESSKPPQHYGLGLAIGNVDVSLYRLVQAYATLAREGLYCHLRLTLGKKAREVRIFSPETAYAIHHVLADPSARLLTFGNPAFFDFGFPVAVKTGTSSNYRDCWIIAYTSRHVVGIWAGNFDGRPTSGGAGATVLGPILKEITDYLYSTGEPEPFAKSAGIREESICWLSGKSASARCPHVTKELVLPASDDPVPCDLSHEPDQNYYLGSQYAQWIHHREVQQGRGRFRLMGPEAAFSGSASPYKNPSSMRPNSRAKASTIEIVSPHESARFILSPHTSGSTLFRAVPNPVVDHVVWLLDGVEIARTPPPYELVWKLVRGRHTLHVVTPSREAAQVSFQVD